MNFERLGKEDFHTLRGSLERGFGKILAHGVANLELTAPCSLSLLGVSASRSGPSTVQIIIHSAGTLRNESALHCSQNPERSTLSFIPALPIDCVEHFVPVDAMILGT